MCCQSQVLSVQFNSFNPSASFWILAVSSATPDKIFWKRFEETFYRLLTWTTFLQIFSYPHLTFGKNRVLMVSSAEVMGVEWGKKWNGSWFILSWWDHRHHIETEWSTVYYFWFQLMKSFVAKCYPLQLRKLKKCLRNQGSFNIIWKNILPVAVSLQKFAQW
jgi:hypothetical protein